MRRLLNSALQPFRIFSLVTSLDLRLLVLFAPRVTNDALSGIHCAIKNCRRQYVRCFLIKYCSNKSKHLADEVMHILHCFYYCSVRERNMLLKLFAVLWMSNQNRSLSREGGNNKDVPSLRKEV